MASNEIKDGKTLDVDFAAAGNDGENKGNRCSIFQGNADAKGFAWLGFGRGMLVMSNIYFSQSLLYLSKVAAGCDPSSEELCLEKVHGLVASVWVSNVAVIAGVLVALFMPFFGALVDFTDYRRGVGIFSAILMTVIQAVQIGTVQKTWFPMLLLQAVAVVPYQMQVVVIYAYLPDIARSVGQSTMNKFTNFFQGIQFLSQSLFIVIMVVIQLLAKTSTVENAQVSQGLNTLSSVIIFSVGWYKYLTARPAVRKLPEGHNIITEGYRNNWKTAKNMWKNFRKGLLQFFLAVCFAAAAAQTIASVSVIYLNDVLKINGIYQGIFFLVTLLSTLVGNLVGYYVTMKTNPKTSYKLSMFYIFICLLVPLFIELLPRICVFIWGIFIGVGLGWYYPVENLIFSLILPKGQETELAGFYVFCTQVLGWLPPLCFGWMIQNLIPQKYAIIVVASFFLVAIVIMMCTASWEEIVEQGATAVVKDSIVDVGDSSGKDKKDEAVTQ